MSTGMTKAVCSQSRTGWYFGITGSTAGSWAAALSPPILGAAARARIAKCGYVLQSKSRSSSQIWLQNSYAARTHDRAPLNKDQRPTVRDFALCCMC